MTETAAMRLRRADAQRNLEALLDAAKAVFAVSGVDAPAEEITDRAGVGVGTLYRHFPQRSDLVLAVLKHEIDACATRAGAERGQSPGGSADEVDPALHRTDRDQGRAGVGPAVGR